MSRTPVPLRKMKSQSNLAKTVEWKERYVQAKDNINRRVRHKTLTVEKKKDEMGKQKWE